MNSECVSLREKIAALALGDLSDAERRELELHLDGCPECRLERESFTQTVRALASVEDEPAPRHFFITPDTGTVSPWRSFFRMPQMPFYMRAAFAGVVILALLSCGAALSQFHVRFDHEGWSAGFGHGGFDTAALREELLETAAEDSLKNQQQWMEEVRNEIALLKADEEQKTQRLEEILIRLDSRIDGRVGRSEEQMRQDMQILAAVLYQELARQRAVDMEMINIRMETAEIRESLNARKTEEILLTLLQYADTNL